MTADSTSLENLDGSSISKMMTRVVVQGKLAKINADGLLYRDLNAMLKRLIPISVERVEIHNLYGQRYLGTGVNGSLEITVYGTPGNDLGAFMDGPRINVYGNVQDGCGNTMNDGVIVVHGHAGDITGYSMRGGKIFVRDSVGYRTGIHMKEYRNIKPIIVIGGSVRDFLGEYLAGGVILVLGINSHGKRHPMPKYVAAGMHGGVIYVRGKMTHLGREVEVLNVDKTDLRSIQNLVGEFCDYFNFCFDEIMSEDFTKIIPLSKRPYGKLYAY